MLKHEARNNMYPKDKIKFIFKLVQLTIFKLKKIISQKTLGLRIMNLAS